MKRVIIKIGTKILTTPKNKLDLNNLRRLVCEISYLIKQHELECILVSSGSIISGAEELNITPTTMPEKQASASVGQLLLLNEYHQFFSQNSIKIGQILLTKDIFQDSTKKTNVLNTITALLKHNVMPIINENDTVAVDEIQFGDNDILTSTIAPLLNAELVVFLTDTSGVYDKNPMEHSDAKLIPVINHISDQDINEMPGSLDSKSKGGIKSKLISAKICYDNGIEAGIANAAIGETAFLYLTGRPIGIGCDLSIPIRNLA